MRRGGSAGGGLRQQRPALAPRRGATGRSRPRGAGGAVGDPVGAGARRGRGWGRGHGRAVRGRSARGRPGLARAERRERCRLSNRRWAAPGAPAAPCGTCLTVRREGGLATPTRLPDIPLPLPPSLSYGLRKCSSSSSSRCRRSSRAVSRNLMRPDCLVM